MTDATSNSIEPINAIDSIRGAKVLACTAGYDRGGLGQHFTWVIEEARAAGELRRYFGPYAKEGDDRPDGPGMVLHERLAPWLGRWTPVRFSPGWRNHLENDLFDLAVARRLDAPITAFCGFGGQSLRSYREAHKLGCRRLEMVAANSHVENVARRHAAAVARYPFEGSWLNGAQRRKTLREYAMADRIYIASDYSWRTFVEAGVSESKPVRVHYPPRPRFAPPVPGDPNETAKPDDGVFRLVYVGAVTVVKGVPDLLEAFARLSARLPKRRMELTLVGGTGTRGMHRYVSGWLARDSRIRLAPGDPLPHLRRTDVYVHPSYEDNLAYAALEAHAAGVPVVVTEDTGTKEYVREGVDGFIYPTGDIDALADRLEAMGRGERFRAGHRDRSRRGMRGYELTVNVAEINRMRIAHYMTGLWKGGGIATYVHRVTQGLREDGHEIFLFDRRDHAPGNSAAGTNGTVTYVEGEAELFRAAARLDVNLLHVHTFLDDADSSPVPLLRTLHNHEPYCPSGTRFLGRSRVACDRAYSLLGCAWGHWFDGCGSRRPGQVIANFRRTRSERRVLRKTPVVAVSEFVREQMLRAGYEAEWVHTLPLFAPEPQAAVVPPPLKGSEGEPPRFVFLGRITPLKGVDWLLRAAAAVRVPIRLDIAGDGSPRDEQDVRELARDLGLADRVTFHGWVGPEKVASLLRSCRALVFPSLWHEPAGLGVVEAAAHGRATIVSRVGGTPEYIRPGTTGLLVEPDDVAGLAGAVERLAAEYTLARDLGEAGRRLWAERFTLRRHLGPLTGLYRRYARGEREAKELVTA